MNHQTLFATGRNPSHASVAATVGILRLLSEDELEGVMAHELAHVQNRDTLTSTIAATIAGAITWIAHMVQWSAMWGGMRREITIAAEPWERWLWPYWRH